MKTKYILRTGRQRIDYIANWALHNYKVLFNKECEVSDHNVLWSLVYIAVSLTIIPHLSFIMKSRFLDWNPLFSLNQLSQWIGTNVYLKTQTVTNMGNAIACGKYIKYFLCNKHIMKWIFALSRTETMWRCIMMLAHWTVYKLTYAILHWHFILGAVLNTRWMKLNMQLNSYKFDWYPIIHKELWFRLT